MWLLLFLLTVNIAAAAVTITGSVVDETGNPIAGWRALPLKTSDIAAVVATTTMPQESSASTLPPRATTTSCASHAKAFSF